MELSTVAATVHIDKTSVLESVSVTASPGKLLVLAGESGSGKTTLLNVLGLLRRIDSGRVLVDGVDRARWSDSRRRTFWRNHVAFVFQDYGLIEDATVEYNVSIARRTLFGLSEGDRARVDEILEHVRLPGRNKEQTARLSGGEKQRVGLARAMFRSADVVLADEPTASLDRANRELVTSFLIEEARRGATVVIATHDEELMNAGDEVIRLDRPTTTPGSDDRQPAVTR